MKYPRIFASTTAVVALALCAGPAAAVVELQRVDWQRAAQGAAAAARKPQVLTSLTLSPGDKLPARLGGLVKLLNRGPVPEEGILLRYVVTARVVPAAGGEAVWSLPFLLDTRRVPKIGPNQIVDVSLDASTLLDLYLRKLTREGWWLDALKLEVLLEPRRGEPQKLQILRAELPVAKK